tara:strand:- start:235 stop:525 length:291 start_codon:yes stop_codon:yes gene_type:complete
MSETTEEFEPSKYQLAVGKCPACDTYPDWFNNVPLTAYCFKDDCPGFDESTGAFMKRVVPPGTQPYNDLGDTWGSKWVKHKDGGWNGTSMLTAEEE